MSNNYLFAPFKDDDDKIREFNEVVIALNYVVDTEETHFHESALHGLRVFIGRLESYYDVIISQLKADESESIGWIEQYKLGALNYRREIKELKAENDKLKADYDNDINVSYELDDKHIKIISDLEVENDGLAKLVMDLREEIESLQDQLKNAVNDYELLMNSNGVK